MNDNAKKLIAALRSGEFAQGRDALRHGDTYCCLGVGCEIFRRETGQGKWVEGDHLTWRFNVGDNNSDVALPDPVRHWLDFAGTRGEYEGGSNLADDNDRGATFEEIADTIENRNLFS